VANRQVKVRATKDQIANLINKEIPPIERIKLAADLARGVKVQETKVDRKGDVNVVVYTTKPDLNAIEFLENYASGKPVQKQEVKLDDALSCIIVPAQRPSPTVATIREAKRGSVTE
jgi:hypothetical protein